MDKEEFNKEFPTAKKEGVNSLFKFMSVDKLEYVESIFVDNNIFLSPPNTLNDPFEGIAYTEEMTDSYKNNLKNYLIYFL